MKAVGNLKVCSKCKQTKSLDEFYKNITTCDGLGHLCKECQKAKVNKRNALLRQIRLSYKQENKTAVPQRGIKAILSLGDFEDSQLFAELRRRGYNGELQYHKTIAI